MKHFDPDNYEYLERVARAYEPERWRKIDHYQNSRDEIHRQAARKNAFDSITRARRAIGAMKDPTRAMTNAGVRARFYDVNTIFSTMINEALK